MIKKRFLLISSLSLFTPCIGLVGCSSNNIDVVGGLTQIYGEPNIAGIDGHSGTAKIGSQTVDAKLSLEPTEPWSSLENIHINEDGFIYWSKEISTGDYHFKIKAEYQNSFGYSDEISLKIGMPETPKLVGGSTTIYAHENEEYHDSANGKLVQEGTELPATFELIGGNDINRSMQVGIDENGLINGSNQLEVGGKFALMVAATYENEKFYSPPITLEVKEQSELRVAGIKWNFARNFEVGGGDTVQDFTLQEKNELGAGTTVKPDQAVLVKSEDVTQEILPYDFALVDPGSHSYKIRGHQGKGTVLGKMKIKFTYRSRIFYSDEIQFGIIKPSDINVSGGNTTFYLKTEPNESGEGIIPTGGEDDKFGQTSISGIKINSKMEIKGADPEHSTDKIHLKKYDDSPEANKYTICGDEGLKAGNYTFTIQATIDLGGDQFKKLSQSITFFVCEPASQNDFTIEPIDDTNNARIVQYNGKSDSVGTPSKYIDSSSGKEYNIIEIGDDAFNFDGAYKPKFIIIGDGITSIGNSVFMQNEKLVKVLFPDSLLSIGDSAFMNCESLQTPEFPRGLTSIGNSAFIHCSSMTGQVIIPKNVKLIDEFTFFDTNINYIDFLCDEGQLTISYSSLTNDLLYAITFYTKKIHFMSCSLESSNLTLITYPGIKSDGETQVIKEDGGIKTVAPDCHVHCSDGTDIPIP